MLVKVKAKLKKPHPGKEMFFEKHLVTLKYKEFDMDESVLKSSKANAWLNWELVNGGVLPSGTDTVEMVQPHEKVIPALVPQVKRGRPAKVKV